MHPDPKFSWGACTSIMAIACFISHVKLIFLTNQEWLAQFISLLLHVDLAQTNFLILGIATGSGKEIRVPTTDLEVKHADPLVSGALKHIVVVVAEDTTWQKWTWKYLCAFVLENTKYSRSVVKKSMTRPAGPDRPL
jgi:hypothetical protein